MLTFKIICIGAAIVALIGAVHVFIVADRVKRWEQILLLALVLAVAVPMVFVAGAKYVG